MRKIIALTSFDGDQENLPRALDAGVGGYLLKEMVHTEVLPRHSSGSLPASG